MRYFVILICFVAIASCNNKETIKPIFLNNTKKLYNTADTFLFKNNAVKWQAYLYTFVQAIPLKIKNNKDTLQLNLNSKYGIIEGEAHICLQHNDAFYFYPIVLKNSASSNIIFKDYRSPKTVNPDSNLVQQSIKHRIDLNRNIKTDSNKNYFTEEHIKIAPIVKTFRAIATEPITANYLQAGSAVNISIKATYNNSLQLFEIETDTIYDAYNNIIADGTQVVFEYSNQSSKGLINATTVHGKAKVLLPLDTNGNWNIVASINNVKSKKINLVK